MKIFEAAKSFVSRAIRRAKSALVALSLASVATTASATTAPAGLDFSAVTSAVDATTVVAAVTAIAAIKILPGVAKWGYDKVIRWFGG